MPVPVDAITRAQAALEDPAQAGPRAILAAAERLILRALADARGDALTRGELGVALRGAALAGAGVEVASGLRETLLAFAGALLPGLEREMQASAEVVDVALTRLVRSDRIGFAIHGGEARFWSPATPALADDPTSA